MAAAATTEVFEKKQEQSEETETLDGNCRAKGTGGHFPVSTPALGKVRFVLPTSVFSVISCSTAAVSLFPDRRLQRPSLQARHRQNARRPKTRPVNYPTAKQLRRVIGEVVGRPQFKICQHRNNIRRREPPILVIMLKCECQPG